MAKRYLHWVSPQLVVEFLATPQDDGAAEPAAFEAATAWAATAESTAEEMARHRPPWAENLAVFHH